MLCCSNQGWQAGGRGGIILSCGDRLARSVNVFSQKSWRQCSSSLVSRQERHSSDEGHGFLSVVFTHALTAQSRRLAASGDGDVNQSQLDEASSLNEVCLNMKPCDVVFSGPVFASLLSLFSLPAQHHSSESSPHSDDTASSAVMPLLTSRSLPLLYINIRDFRLFVPIVECSVDGPGDGKQAGSCQHPVFEDVFIFHVGSVVIVPHAVNPLARLIIDKTTYSRALHAGITGRIGSEVEDRQYQMDVSGLGVSTGCWHQLLTDENDGHSLVAGVASENPALAWNMLLSSPNVRYMF